MLCSGTSVVRRTARIRRATLINRDSGRIRDIDHPWVMADGVRLESWVRCAMRSVLRIPRRLRQGVPGLLVHGLGVVARVGHFSRVVLVRNAIHFAQGLDFEEQCFPFLLQLLRPLATGCGFFPRAAIGLCRDLFRTLAQVLVRPAVSPGSAGCPGRWRPRSRSDSVPIPAGRVAGRIPNCTARRHFAVDVFGSTPRQAAPARFGDAVRSSLPTHERPRVAGQCPGLPPRLFGLLSAVFRSWSNSSACRRNVSLSSRCAGQVQRVLLSGCV